MFDKIERIFLKVKQNPDHVDLLQEKKRGDSNK